MLEAYAYFARSGITVAWLPAEHGGSGLPMLNHGLVLEESPQVPA
jgi:alkylation response protein AidB-like acyl-CoA dehydrogenase